MKKVKANSKGLTLLEVVIVIVIVGVMTGIAMAVYRPYILKSKRKQAIADLLTLEQALGRQYLLNNGSYRLNSSDTGTADKTASGSCTTSTTSSEYTSGGNPVAYRFIVALTNTRQSYTITAEPCGKQADDKCGSFKIDNTGLREVKRKGASAFAIDKDCF